MDPIKAILIKNEWQVSAMTTVGGKPPPISAHGRRNTTHGRKSRRNAAKVQHAAPGGDQGRDRSIMLSSDALQEHAQSVEGPPGA
jgi:hypothetical protein